MKRVNRFEKISHFFCFFFHFVRSQKYEKDFGKNVKILRKKLQREIINYDTLKTSNAELLEEKIPKVFFAIYFCSYEREIINYDT